MKVQNKKHGTFYECEVRGGNKTYKGRKVRGGQAAGLQEEKEKKTGEG